MATFKNNRLLEVSVGIFVLASFLAFVFLTFSVSQFGFNTQSSQSYRLYAYFEDVGGLRDNAVVSMSGVQIGQIETIELDSKKQKAKVGLRIDKKIDFLTTDSSLSIRTAGLLGEKYLSIETGSDDLFLSEGDLIEQTQSALVLEDLIGKFLLK